MLPRASAKCFVDYLEPASESFVSTIGLHGLIQRAWGLTDIVATYLPCAHPRSLSRRDIPALNTQNYVVGVKTDGVRMMLYMGNHEGLNYVVMIDRAFRVYFIHLNDVICADVDCFRGTMLDGELVRHENSNHYVLFDAIQVRGEDTRGMTFSQRVEKIISVNLKLPRVALVDVKRWTPFREFEPRGETGGDGLVFVDDAAELRAGTQPTVFKWKSHHTIDFMWDAKRRKLTLTDAGGQNYVSTSKLKIRVNTEMFSNNLHRCVVECVVEKAGDGWLATPVCLRDDKKKPNNINIAALTLQHISENLQLTEIFPSTKINL